ncbi:hypothetical protein [Bacillus thuringiensis]|uniref:hypothetical protein n=1 Tax=Bacillus thuringiensis TaxID=1428 RepID=UPI000BFC9602|nr:hypothetical protein [Bacillus thuringiensis]PGT90065.1 hypothetical protein COD17_09960 [Bacillus thuringiensis]
MSKWTMAYQIPQEYASQQDFGYYDMSCICLYFNNENLITDTQGGDVAIAVSELFGIPCGDEHLVTQEMYEKGKEKWKTYDFEDVEDIDKVKERVGAFLEAIEPVIETAKRVVISIE